MQFYSEPERENDPYALPDAEVFYHDDEDDCLTDEDGEPLPEGYYYWLCLPGCLPDSDPIGPFETEQEAIDDFRDSVAC